MSLHDWINAEENGKFRNCEILFRFQHPNNIEQIKQQTNIKQTELTSSISKVIIHHNAIEFSHCAGTPVVLRQSISHPEETVKKITTVSARLLQKKELEDTNTINLSILVKNVIKRTLISLEDNQQPTWITPHFSLLSVEQLHQLCIGTQQILQKEQNCVNVKAPARVFGDIHGQIAELLILFKTFGSPNHYVGDVELVSYVFNGDFVDRGPNSLEVITLLFCLKVAYPHKVFLIRGNHEDPSINSHYGFKQECKNRLGDDCGEAIWKLFNQVFTFLPISALINQRILCLHGGIGGAIESIEQINKIPKPIVDTANSREVIDILWSDPAESDKIVGVHANHQRGKSIVSFGSDRVRNFCEKNQIDLIIRSHQCPPCGYEFFSSGHLITVFSAANYQNSHNDGALLEISVNHLDSLVVRPKVYRAPSMLNK